MDNIENDTNESGLKEETPKSGEYEGGWCETLSGITDKGE